MNLPTRSLLLLAAGFISPMAMAITLTDAESALRAHNTELRTADASVRGAQAEAAVAALRPAPELSLGSSKVSPHYGIGSGRWQDKRIDSTVGLGWTWERGGKRQLRSAQANAQLRASVLQRLDAQRLQQLALHEQYFTLKAAEEMAELAQNNQQISAEGLRAARREVDVGAMAPLQFTRLAADDLAVADQAREAQSALRAARADLALLLGRDDDGDLHAQDPWPALEQDPAIAPAAAVDTRVDLRAAQAHLQAAESGVALARSGRHRDVQLGLEMEREPQDIGGVTWGVSMTIPLGGSTRWRGEQQRAEADRDIAALELQQLRRQARSEIAQLQQQVQTAQQRRSAYETMASTGARASLEGMELAYRRGAANLTDLLDARRSWRELEAELIDARASHAIALAQLRAASTVNEGETP